VLDSPVGRVEDVFGGIHASQNTTADKPKLTRRVNLLTKTEDFSDAAWVKQGTTTAPSANTILFQSDYQAITQAVAFAGGAAVGSSASFKVVLSGSGSCDIFVARSSGGTYEQTIVRVNLTNTPTQYAVTHTIQNPGQNGFVSGITRTPGATATLVTATNAALVPAADARYPYQKVNTATSYDTLGFPARWDFDTTDTLQLTLPAGYESATIIDATSAGPVTLLEQDVTGTYNIGPSLSTHGRIILRDTPTARQLELCQGLANRLAGL
jgi:hypothetical protein